jgi:hypothetical protein
MAASVMPFLGKMDIALIQCINARRTVPKRQIAYAFLEGYIL